MASRIDVIMIPAASRFNFPCSKLPYIAQINTIIKGQQDWNRYRRK
ncbi:MAG: hypothetical protein IJ141_02110 [Lachnospiraceae bacterium]|nr:hypothetical protein [Lachnospiraceae bacterium]